MLAQYIGIAFARLGKLNDPDGDSLSDAVVTVASSQSNAAYFEGDAKNPRRMMDMRTPVAGNSVSEQTRSQRDLFPFVTDGGKRDPGGCGIVAGAGVLTRA